MNIALEILLFTFTISFYLLGVRVYKRYSTPILNPLPFSIVLIVAMLLSTKVPLEVYQRAVYPIHWMLGPCTVILAVPLYKQFHLLKKNYKAVLSGIFVGSLSALISIAIMATLFKLGKPITLSLLPKSITTPIGFELSKMTGALTSLTVVTIVMTGITGVIIAPLVFKLFRIHHPIARGIALGTAAHAMGTSKALEFGEKEGAFAALSISIAGVSTILFVVIANLIYPFF